MVQAYVLVLWPAGPKFNCRRVIIRVLHMWRALIADTEVIRTL